MVDNKSLEPIEVIAALMEDVSRLSGVFTPRSLRLTKSKLRARYDLEGVGFLTKTLPLLGKSFDKALSGHCFDYTGWEQSPHGKFPRFLGELFQTVFGNDGALLPHPRTDSARYIRQICYTFYKYELPADPATESRTLESFKDAERETSELRVFAPTTVIRSARKHLHRLLCAFDPTDILPRHGPGAVADKATFSEKYSWTTFPKRLTSVFPVSEYYTCGLGHTCDTLREFAALPEFEPRARVILVPKDSRGPRVISAEPKEFQWIQQGVMRALVSHIESHPLTKGYVNFTDQSVNRTLALSASVDGSWATLDLKEASDRVSIHLVRALFPAHVFRVLNAVRSRYTCLPNQETMRLVKHAPMGSALCFPVMALCIHAVLIASGIPSDSIYVYGDDVIVPRETARYAMTVLESVGLKVNTTKSCFEGFFRESCGMDAFLGVDITPVRFRTVWSVTPAASPYYSFIAYANDLYKRGYSEVATLVATRLRAVYGAIRTCDMENHPGYPCLSFCVAQTDHQPNRRYNPALQRVEHNVLVGITSKVTSVRTGWDQLLRFFSESGGGSRQDDGWFNRRHERWGTEPSNPFTGIARTGLQTSIYTDRRRSKLRRMWR